LTPEASKHQSKIHEEEKDVIMTVAKESRSVENPITDKPLKVKEYVKLLKQAYKTNKAKEVVLKTILIEDSF